MPWTIPDKGEGDNDLQSVMFQEYLDVLVAGLSGVDCVLAGCAVTGGADMTPAVAAGVVRSNGVQFAVTAADVTIGAADGTNPRIDLIVINNAGAKAVRAGTAGANPKPPARSANDVVLAAVLVLANDTSIETTKLTDMRVFRNQADQGHIYELTMSNNGTDAVNDIDVQAGEAVSEGGTHLMVLAATITKQIDVTWAVGTNAGGLNTGVVANATWYEVHLIKRADTGVVDVMFTTPANRATLPANYTHQRRIGWVRRGTAANLAFTQIGDTFTLTTQINDVAASVTVTAAAVTLTVPPDTIARFRATVTMGTASAVGTIVFSEIVEGNVTPADTTGIGSIGLADFAAASAAAGHFELRVSATSQIEHDASNATGTPTFDISTYGWHDRRRRMEAI
jgi:hypothetical protein